MRIAMIQNMSYVYKKNVRLDKNQKLIKVNELKSTN